MTDCYVFNKKEKNPIKFLKFECSLNTVYSNNIIFCVLSERWKIGNKKKLLD